MPTQRRSDPSLLRQSWWIFALAFVVVGVQQLGWQRVGHALAAPGRVLATAAEVLWPVALATVVALWRARRVQDGPHPATERAPRRRWPLPLLALMTVGLVLACVFVLPRLLVPPLRVSPTAVQSAKDRLQLANDRLKAQNDVRVALLQGLGGVVLVAGAYVSWRQVRASLDAQVGERLAGAIEQLGSAEVATRVAGVYFLDRVLWNSTRDAGMVVGVLTNLVRQKLPWPPPPGGPISLSALRDRAPDAQVALTVLGTRPISADIQMWLADLDLRQASLFGSQFPRANFRGSSLEGASLRGGNFQGATFRGCQLRRANLLRANFQGASFEDADLRGAVLQDADLRNATLKGARLELADLRRAHNLGAPGDVLTREQWESALTSDWAAKANQALAADLVKRAGDLARERAAPNLAVAELAAAWDGNRTTVQLAAAECLVLQDMDWPLRLRAAELLDLVLQHRQGPVEAPQRWRARITRWWRKT